MKKFFVILVCVGMVFFTGVSGAYALSVLVSEGVGVSYGGYGLSTSWANMTAALDAATSNNVDVVSNFEDFSEMDKYDALWLDQRGLSGSLSATEISNITAFVGTGRRVVMIGEGRTAWTAWNKQILSVVGDDTYSGAYSSGYTNSIVSNELTDGVSQVYVRHAGLVSGGTALFGLNFATLWGDNDNVLTVLDVDAFGYSYNTQFLENIAKWIANSESPNVASWIANSESPPSTPPAIANPEPSTIFLLGIGLIGLVGLGWKKFSKK